jgi:ribosomal protein L40E
MNNNPSSKPEEKEERQKSSEEKYKAQLVCMRCGALKTEMIDSRTYYEEKVCAKCGSNSIRIKKI